MNSQDTLNADAVRPAATPLAHRKTSRRTPSRARHRAAGTLSPRQRQVLRWLLRLPMLRVDDLTVLCGASRSTIVRTIYALETRGRVEAVRPSGLAGQGVTNLYHLTDSGLKSLAHVLRADPALLAQAHGSTERGLLRLLPQLPQLVRLQSLLTGLVAGAQPALMRRSHLPSGSWHIVRPYYCSFTWHGNRLKLDVAGVLTLHLDDADEEVSRSALAPSSLPSNWYAAFVVSDTQAADWRGVERQLEQLLRYRECADRWPTYPQFPLVLILSSSARHLERWQQLVQESARRLRVPPLACAAIVAPRHEATSHPWDIAWYDLRSGRSSSLQLLWVPLTHAALSPGLDGSDEADHSSKHRRGPGRPLHHSGRPMPHIITGHYMARAAARWTISSDGAETTGEHHTRTHKQHNSARAFTAEGSSDRVVTKGDDVALLSLCLTTRQQAILTQLFVTPYLTISQLAVLMDVQADSMSRYLRTLRQWGLIVYWVDGAGTNVDDGEPQLSLTRFGRHLTAHLAGISLHSREALGTRRGPGGKAAHRKGVYDFFASLITAARSASTTAVPHRLLWWETGALCELRYHDHERWHNLRPDGAGVYRIGTRRIRFWLEYDTGTMSYRDLVPKFKSYAAYLATGHWRETSDRTLPLLLVVAPDRSQRDRLMRVASNAFLAHAPSQTGTVGRTAENGTIPQLRAYVTLAELFFEVGPLAAIWWPMVLETDRTDGRRCVVTTQAIFVPPNQ